MSRRKRPRVRPTTAVDRWVLGGLLVSCVALVVLLLSHAAHRPAAKRDSHSDAHSQSDGHDHTGHEPPILAGAGLPPLPPSKGPLARPKEQMAEAYAYAAEHPEVLQKLPCFCGCMKRGHRSNHDCFVTSRDAASHVTWNAHGLTCGMCVDIARDAKRMVALGKTTDEIRAAIDGAYGKGAQ